MIVRFTNRQRGRVEERIEQHSGRSQLALIEWFGRDCTPTSKHRVDVAMPAIAWQQAEHVMFAFCFDSKGFKSRNAKTMDQTAFKSIRRALNVRESHPALSQTGAVGMISELIPAWKYPAPDASGKFYTPYPMPTMQFVILAPEMRTIAGRSTTQWVEAIRPFDYPLLNENEHLRFA